VPPDPGPPRRLQARVTARRGRGRTGRAEREDRDVGGSAVMGDDRGVPPGRGAWFVLRRRVDHHLRDGGTGPYPGGLLGLRVPGVGGVGAERPEEALADRRTVLGAGAVLAVPPAEVRQKGGGGRRGVDVLGGREQRLDSRSRWTSLAGGNSARSSGRRTNSRA
jgi:hypothetical protein